MDPLVLGGTQLSTLSKRQSSPCAELGGPATISGFWCKCLTGKAIFDVIMGFPDSPVAELGNIAWQLPLAKQS
jgi:hypothetical protein